MCRARFTHYLAGGRPDGARRSYPGARDSTAPTDDAAVELPGRIYFAGRSRTWGGGMAFYDHDANGPAPARAYLITVGQFADVAAQEMHRLPDPADPIEQVLIDGFAGGRHSAGPGRYETLIEVGARDGLPMYTFTAPHGSAAVPHTPPTRPYLAMLAVGLRESQGWDDERIEDYLRSAIG
ncbi:hypothetical protein [Nakamurella lactea]|uniref:hypothetical protein n=1 Tax=Nakamurella lactea TaxID=459515 RepID=UPI001B7FA638|nr:hypothetical protein [Nakamurella lactea]